MDVSKEEHTEEGFLRSHRVHLRGRRVRLDFVSHTRIIIFNLYFCGDFFKLLYFMNQWIFYDIFLFEFVTLGSCES